MAVVKRGNVTIESEGNNPVALVILDGNQTIRHNVQLVIERFGRKEKRYKGRW